jgi:Integrase core domain
VEHAILALEKPALGQVRVSNELNQGPPSANGICERFHKTLQDEFYSTAFRKTLYTSLEQLQIDLDRWMEDYNQNRPHSGKYCFGKTPMQTFLDSRQIAWDKVLDREASATAAIALLILFVRSSLGVVEPQQK